MANEIDDILRRFDAISLNEMEDVKLMNRIDTKYVLPLSVLPAVLEAALTDYFVKEIDGKRVATYDTVYYDTESLDMYMRHHDRQLVRQKIRVRQYADTGEFFLEIKRKNNKGHTRKKRIAVPGYELTADTIGHGKEDTTIADFIEQKSLYTWSTIAPHLRTDFHRITLVNRQKTERLTIDTDIAWQNIITEENRSYPALVIIEIKRNGNVASPMARIMQEQRIHPLKISKYCIGTVLTTPDLKKNRFKAKIRQIEKMLLNQ